MSSQLPPTGFSSSQLEVEGVSAAGSTLPTANTTIASRGYFQALRVPLLRGRSFTAEDVSTAPARVVVNSTFVSRYLGEREPIGARVRMVGRDGRGPWTEIVGVVADARNNGAGAAVRPEVFVPMEQGRDAWNQLFLLARGHGDASSLVSSVRATVAALDPEQPVYLIQTLEEGVALSSFQERTSALLLGIFAGVALVLAAVGIYGVMSYAVSTRTREIGVRMAVGAERIDVLRLVLTQVARLATVGLLIGVGLVMLVRSMIAGLLYGVEPTDPLTLGAVTMTLGAVALAAGWIPAWRASRVNPIHALRYE
jgi:putative ABC transport system permease protein